MENLLIKIEKRAVSPVELKKTKKEKHRGKPSVSGTFVEKLRKIEKSEIAKGVSFLDSVSQYIFSIV